MNHGIKTVSMDDIARSMGISKKTLYKHFSNKSDLVEQVITAHIEAEKAKLDELRATAIHAIDEMVKVCNYVSITHREFNTSALFDLQKYYPAAWNVFSNYKRDYIHEHIKQNLKEGIKEGLYRSDFDADVLGKIYLAGLENIIDVSLFPISEYRFVDVYLVYVEYHLHGILSEKGFEIMKEIELK